jgi:hypothetical protein
MMPLGALVRRIIELQRTGEPPLTLLAVCPNSVAVVEAAILSAVRANAPMPRP